MKKASAQFHLIGMVFVNPGTISMLQYIAIEKSLEPVGLSMDFLPSMQSHWSKNSILQEMHMDMVLIPQALQLVLLWLISAIRALVLVQLEAVLQTLGWPFTRFVGMCLEANAQQLIC